MRIVAAIAACLLLVIVVGAMAADAPEKLVFESKMGPVTFDHAAHSKRENADCTACHDKLFPQSRADINFKAGMHKPAVTNKTACGACHNPGGPAFDPTATANCKKCHGN